VALHQLDQNGQPPGRFGRGRIYESSAAAMDDRTVFPALASTNHRSELVRGMRKSTFKPC
jgi:hypothetical protein